MPSSVQDKKQNDVDELEVNNVFRVGDGALVVKGCAEVSTDLLIRSRLCSKSWVAAVWDERHMLFCAFVLKHIGQYQ